jgi:CMP-N,N'-diacetyllegionaminic acid synthase
MNVYVDIDGTICTQIPGGNYADAVPRPDKIAKINARYDAGDHITYWTARGTVTGIDWREVTEAQLQAWGVKYHVLMFGKPAYDLFICDRVLNVEDL